MKILYLHQYFVTPLMIGGGGTRSYEMAMRMVKAGHEVHIITSDRNGSGNEWREENINGINVHWLPIKYDNKMTFIQRLTAFVKFALKSGSKAIELGGDIIFATSTPLTIAIPAVKTKKALKIPMVFEVRDLWPTLPIAIGALKSPITKFLAKKLEVWAYTHSDYIVGLSQGMCDGVVSTGYSKDKVINIPNSCDIDLFDIIKSEGEKFREKYEWLRQRPLVIYAGTLGLINGVSYLAELAYCMLTINSEIRFLVVGNGYEYDKVKKKAEKLGVLDNNFFIMPAMNKSEMPILFSAATVSTSLFVPLKEMWSNSANKFFDTLASGKPIAINYQGWQKDIIEKEQIGIVLDELDYQMAAESLANYLANKSELTRAGLTSKEIALKHFSRDELATKLINVLENA
jgi:glycosyltransferase involved in cell wall biosynthesis